MVRLLKPLSYYQERYGTWMYGLNKLYLMMEKQHNRGQEGAGLACVKMEAAPGEEYMFRERATGTTAIQEIFGHVHAQYKDVPPQQLNDPQYAVRHLPFAGEIYMGHLRYSTTGKRGLSFIHPFLRRNNWRAKNLCICANFNMTNVEEIFAEIARTGQHPRMFADTYILLEQLGHRLDRESERLFEQARARGLEGLDITEYIEEQLKPGQAILVDKHGRVRTEQIIEPKNYAACSFERVYFSRGSDTDIYRERKELGRQLVPDVLKAIESDIDHTVVSFIPNTAESAFYGLVAGLNDYLNEEKVREIEALGPQADRAALERIISRRVRSEKVAWKDIKMRTFIAEGASRNDLAAHVYDVTYGSVEAGVDNLVVIDDSIVRGTTLRESIIRILDRLHPRRIVIVSSSPQVRYPDYYGIDMAQMDEFIAFRAAVALLQERGMGHVLTEVYARCKAQENRPKEEIRNYVTEIYAPFSQEEISEKMSRMLTSESIRAEVRIVYQTLEGLHKACPQSPGDWYFSGHYPTPGGNMQVNRAYIRYYEKYYIQK